MPRIFMPMGVTVEKVGRYPKNSMIHTPITELM